MMIKVKVITTNTKITSIKMASIKTIHNSISNNMEAVGIMMKRKYMLFKFQGHPLMSSSGYYNADATNQYQHEGGYYDGHQQGYQDEYYNDQYYDQGTPAAGQQPQYGQGGYGFVSIGSCDRNGN